MNIPIDLVVRPEGATDLVVRAEGYIDLAVIPEIPGQIQSWMLFIPSGSDGLEDSNGDIFYVRG